LSFHGSERIELTDAGGGAGDAGFLEGMVVGWFVFDAAVTHYI
jgi:hypothetical protein